MPRRGDNHASLQRSYLEDKRALGKLLKRAERRKNQPRKKVKRKKWKRKIKIEENGPDFEPVRIHLIVPNSQVYHMPLPFEKDPIPIIRVSLLFRLSKFLVNLGFGIILLIMGTCNMMFCAVQLYCLWRGKLSISR
ncbi:hypothetical protein I302_107632 [Kwoniella bestiolae CBS 10118]|uniref:Uncharacterized protein n=1 Tax=Kwoniella bestiolae CBS 10118 TaxID=1296100 RepID=A0A1B9FY01_9TREE|nr:hypothetical protein I302_06629 [Kwoniella bestiolae CBS 10118]OCF23646.1 hypothetical protein I302_06629 [Kwoniella bestiolae CBS 10118]